MRPVLGVQLAQHFNLGTINNSVSTSKKNYVEFLAIVPIVLDCYSVKVHATNREL